MGSDDDLPVHLTKQAMLDAIAATKITPVRLTTDIVEKLGVALDLLNRQHHLQGVVTAHPTVTVLFQLPSTLPDDFRLDGGFRIWPWGWPGYFGVSFTLTVQFNSSPVLTRVFLPQGSPELDLIRSGNFTAVFCRGKRILGSYKVDFSAKPAALENCFEHLRTAENGRPTYFGQAETHYWEILNAQGMFDATLTAADQLSIGWFKAFRDKSDVVARWLSDASTRIDGKSIGLAEKKCSQELESFLRMMLDARFDLQATFDFMSQTLSVDGESVFRLMIGLLDAHAATEHSETIEGQFPDRDDWDECLHLANAMLETYIAGPVFTSQGRYLPWFDYNLGKERRLELQPGHFPPGCPPADYWGRLNLRSRRYGWGLVLNGADAPIDPYSFERQHHSLPLADNLEAVLQSGYNLLDEALTNKIGTIPPKALVQLPEGLFKYVELTERADGVHAVFRTADGLFHVADIESRTHAHTLAIPGEPYGLPEDLQQRIDAGLFLLLCAMIRDFWVIETRETVFSHKVEPNPLSFRKDEQPKRRIIYLPRIRYLAKPDLDRCDLELEHHERRSHWVRGHLRRVGTASEHQLILAERYGLNVPIGYTFVSPHERGKAKRDVIYRSRSAMQCLYTATAEMPDGSPIRWFQFERDVQMLMRALGFGVEHVSASRKADNGVDVYAVKGVDFDETRWIIQCKCWAPKRKVSPSTVRDLIGALTHYPPGTRGMIVTTSGFTSGAKREAETAGIRLVDGEEFVGLVKRAQGEQA